MKHLKHAYKTLAKTPGNHRKTYTTSNKTLGIYI
jgi:hypothetical protein